MINKSTAANDMPMDGGKYSRRHDETQRSISIKAARVLKQLFDPESYSESEREEKKDLYIFLDRELFSYSDVLELTAEKGKNYFIDPDEKKEEAVLIRFAAAYFFHCMLNWKINDVKTEHYRLAGSGPDSFLLNVLADGANRCCTEHPDQEWLKGSSFGTAGGKYVQNSFTRMKDEFRKKIYEFASSSEFVFHEPSGSFRYIWQGDRFRENYLRISISIRSRQRRYDEYESMIQGLLENWKAKYIEVFRKNLEQLNSGKEIKWNITQHFFLKSMGLKEKNNILTKRYPSDLELQLFTLSAGEDKNAFERLKILRDMFYHADSSAGRSGGTTEKQQLEKTLMQYLEQGPDRFSEACRQMKIIMDNKDPEDMGTLMMERYAHKYPNVSRMVIIIAAINRFSDRLNELRSQYEGSMLEEEKRKFLNAFCETEIKKLQMLTKEEIGMLIDSGFTFSADAADLNELLEKTGNVPVLTAYRDVSGSSGQ